LTTDRFWTLLAGEVVVHRAGRPIEVWRAPRALDVAGTVRGRRSARFVAATDVRVEGVSRGALGDGAIIAALADEASVLWDRIETDARRDDDMFLPGATPVPGPWWFRKVTGAALVVQGDAARLAAALPRGVHLLPRTRGRYLLVVSRLDEAGTLDPRDGRRFLYHEVTPFVPVWSVRTGVSVFIPELYPDAWMAVILGREIHGFPKRTARVGFHDDGAELLVEQRLAMRVRWRAEAPCSPGLAVRHLVDHMADTSAIGRAAQWAVDRWHGQSRLGFAALVRKRIGAPGTAGRDAEIDELVRVPFGLDPIERAEPLVVTEADLPGGPGVLHGQVIAGVRLRTGFRFGKGVVTGRARSAR
jgi:hypothetical protein